MLTSPCTHLYTLLLSIYFLGFESIGNFFEVLLEHIINVFEAQERNELVNGRLVYRPPTLPSQRPLPASDLELFNQVNQKQSPRGRAPYASSSPVIDLIPPPPNDHLDLDVIYKSSRLILSSTDEDQPSACQKLPRQALALNNSDRHGVTISSVLPPSTPNNQGTKSWWHLEICF